MKLVSVTMITKLPEIQTFSQAFFMDLYDKTVEMASPWGVNFEKPRVVERQIMNTDNTGEYHRQSAFIPFIDFLLSSRTSSLIPRRHISCKSLSRHS